MRLLSTLIFTFSLSIASWAQPYYFLQATDTYVPLTDSTSVNNGNAWGGLTQSPVSIGFDFDFMDATFTSFNFESTGRLIFDANHYYYADLITINGLDSKPIGGGIESPVSYKLEGPPGQQIFKLEISEAEYNSEVGSDVSFQIWLYEDHSRIELHMGPYTVSNAATTFGTNLFSGVYHVTTWSPLTFAYGLSILGNPNSPQDSTYSGIGINTFGIYLDSIPLTNSVYIYTTDTSSVGITEQSLEDMIYPNPADNHLTIPLQYNSAKVFTSEGKLVLEQTELSGFLNTGMLAEGIYILELKGNKGTRTEKLIIQRE